MFDLQQVGNLSKGGGMSLVITHDELLTIGSTSQEISQLLWISSALKHSEVVRTATRALKVEALQTGCPQMAYYS